MKGFSRPFYLILIAFAPLILCRFDQGSSSLFMSEDNFDLADFPPDIFKAYSKQHLRASVNDSKNRRSLLESKNQSDLPAGLKHQSKEEANYLKLHKCKDAGEAYGAAYLITKEHLIEQFTGLNLTWVNCEMGSFVMVNQRSNPNRNVNGSMTQSLDVLDFGMVHLSWYERLQKRYTKTITAMIKTSKIETEQKTVLNSLAAVEAVVQTLKTRALELRKKDSPFAVPELNRTLAVMPFLGSDMGAGHSKLTSRLVYLQACFWSVYAEMPHVVAVVKSAADAHYAMNVSGLPFYDVLVMKNLPKSASLPVATVQASKARFMDGTWDFDYLFFTESDQLLMMRIHEELYSHLKLYPRRVIIPHRLNPYPEEVVTHVYSRPLNANQPMDWVDMNCCLPRQNCLDRKDWVSMKTNKVPIVNIFGLQVALGNVNFHTEYYRPCVLNELGNLTHCP